jgi:hypothetical protein
LQRRPSLRATALPKDRQVAEKYLSTAADQGFPLAQYPSG